MTNKIYDFLWNNPKYSKLSSPVYWDSTGACRVVSHIFCDKYAGDYPCKIVKDGHSNTSSPEDKTIILQKYGDEDLKIIEVIDQDDRQFYLPMLPDGTTNETIAIRCPSDVFNSNATSKYQDPTKGSIINLQPAKLVISILPTSKSPSTTDGYSNKTTSAKLTSILSDTTPKSDAQTDQIKCINISAHPNNLNSLLLFSKSPKPIPEPTPPFFPIQPVSPNEPQVSESDLSLGQTGRPPTENFPNTADYGHANNHIDPDAMDNYGRPTMLNNHPENNLHGDGENITTTNQSLGCPQCITHHALYKKSGKTTEGDYEEYLLRL
ncbi:uncharacterized protein TRIADDRAFT_51326 [Trichoplax adhaerens]|uniref:Uncharacterized protein n=1 Tax=Trichoplax adhaerens TaxID=10228 RepID=B3RII1_TRIAD|nr:predicted protein [Trichoplax adhaerens]EDV28424.1 predicted protein [Trichoplax adhaerens]|eukprot:XP_002107626.1 predicted protein [Trichoplax adhaerens]